MTWHLRSSDRRLRGLPPAWRRRKPVSPLDCVGAHLDEAPLAGLLRLEADRHAAVGRLRHDPMRLEASPAIGTLCSRVGVMDAPMRLEAAYDSSLVRSRLARLSQII